MTCLSLNGSPLVSPTSSPMAPSYGANWIIFPMRFREAHFWVYLEGTKPYPKSKDAGIDAAEKWEYEDTVVGYLLSLHLPDTTVMRLIKCCTARERWEMVSNEYLAKSVYPQSSLH